MSRWTYVTVSPLVIVPGNDLVELGVEGHGCFGVKGGGGGAVDKVLTDDGLVGVGEDALEFTFGSLFDGGLDVFGGAFLFGADRQVDKGDVGRRHADGHAGQLSFQLGNDLTDGLCGSGGCGDQVVEGGPSGTPVLASLGGSIDDELVCGSGVDGGHETFEDSKLVVQYLGERRKAVGGAGCVGEDSLSGVLVFVDSHDEHGGILGRRRDDDALGSALQVFRGLVDDGEDSSGFADGVGASLSPRNVW